MVSIARIEAVVRRLENKSVHGTFEDDVVHRLGEPVTEELVDRVAQLIEESADEFLKYKGQTKYSMSRLVFPGPKITQPCIIDRLVKQARKEVELPAAKTGDKLDILIEETRLTRKAIENLTALLTAEREALI